MDGAWSVLLVLGALACFTAGAAAVLVGQRYALDLLSPPDAEETALEAGEIESVIAANRERAFRRLDGTPVPSEDAARLRTEFEALLTASEEDEASEEDRGALDRDALVTVPAAAASPAPVSEAVAPPTVAPAAPSATGEAGAERVLRCSGSHARHDYVESPFTPRRCNRCGCEEPRAGSGVKSPVTTAEEAAAWQSGSVPASIAGPARPPRAKDEAGKRPRAALRGGSSEPLTVYGEPRAAGETPQTCPKCSGRLTEQEDEYGDLDTFCVRDGWRPTRTPSPGDGLAEPGKARLREPRHAGAVI